MRVILQEVTVQSSTGRHEKVDNCTEEEDPGAAIETAEQQKAEMRAINDLAADLSAIAKAYSATTVFPADV